MAGRGTLCSSGAPMDSPPGPPRRTANQNHSAPNGNQACSQLQPEAARRLNPVSGLASGAALGVHGADDTPGPPHPAPPPAPPPAGYWLPAAKWSLHVLQPGCVHKSCCSGRGAAPGHLRGASGSGQPAGQRASLRARQASGVEEHGVWNQRDTGSERLHHLLAMCPLLASVSPLCGERGPHLQG